MNNIEVRPIQEYEIPALCEAEGDKSEENFQYYQRYLIGRKTESVPF